MRGHASVPSVRLSLRKNRRARGNKLTRVMAKVAGKRERERSLPTGDAFYLGRRVRAVARVVALSWYVRSPLFVPPRISLVEDIVRAFGPFSTYSITRQKLQRYRTTLNKMHGEKRIRGMKFN